MYDNSCVFPASAGVILRQAALDDTAPGFPRIRGGDPCALRRVLLHTFVFPASAGVILLVAILRFLRRSFPRIRGGDPYFLSVYVIGLSFSPHPRG